MSEFLDAALRIGEKLSETNKTIVFDVTTLTDFAADQGRIKQLGLDFNIKIKDGKFVNDFNDKIFDVEKFKESKIKGDPIGIFESLGIDITNKFDKNMIETLKAATKDNVTIKLDKILEEVRSNAVALDKIKGDIKSTLTEAEFKQNMPPEIKAFLEEQAAKMKEQAIKDGKSGKSTIDVGKWLKRTLSIAILVGAGWGGYSLYQEVETHRNEMAGCWLEQVGGQGYRCKIGVLTCNERRTPGKLCGSFTESPGIILSCPDTRFAKITTPADITSVCFKEGSTCTKVSNANTQEAKCDVSLKPVVDCEDCTTCDAGVIPVPYGYALKCELTTWGQAATDLGFDPFKGPINSLKKVFLWIGLICGSILGIWLFYLLISFLMRLGTGFGGGKKGGTVATLSFNK